jgi:hypothetical protein
LRQAIWPISRFLQDVALRLFKRESAIGTKRNPELGTKRIKTVGAVLIVVGIVALIVGRISYTTHKEVVTIGPYQTSIETRRVVALRPFGVLSILGGLMLVAGGKRIHIVHRPGRLLKKPPTMSS